MSCKYCTPANKVKWGKERTIIEALPCEEGQPGSAYIDGNMLMFDTTQTAEYGEGQLKINFCPMCGDSLCS